MIKKEKGERRKEMIAQLKMDIDPVDSGAEFSEDRKFRYSLWRIWDNSRPLVMFIGLNPSTANETEPDATIKKVIKITRNNGYGGFYMMNLFPIVSRDPKVLKDINLNNDEYQDNIGWLHSVAEHCENWVFAWGAFSVLKKEQSCREWVEMIIHQFPHALCLDINQDGSPKHPLFCFDKQVLKPFKRN